MSGRRVAALGALACLACCIGPLWATVAGVGLAGAFFGPVGATLGVIVGAVGVPMVRARRSRRLAVPTPERPEPTSR